MSAFSSKGLTAAAVLIAGLAIASAAPVFADEPAPLAAPNPTGKVENPADNALRRPPSTPATRAADRVHCRELAARRRLFGLGRHKFLQRCRRARRRGAPIPAR